MTTSAPVADSADASTTGQETAGFVHLHVHTEHSKLDGLSRLADITKHAAASGQTALAMTDHENMGGAWKFVNACKKAGIKPILGIETYMALVPDGTGDTPAMAWDDPQVRFAKEARQGFDAETGSAKRVTNNHLTILARNEAGWRNLCAISNAAQDSIYYKALVDYALIKDHSEGLIILSGCLGGPVASHVAQHGAKNRAAAAMRARLALRESVEDLRAERGRLCPVGEGDHDSSARVADIDATIAVLDANPNDSEQAATALDAAALTDLDAARDNLAHLIECVGAENVYVEIMEHGLASEGKEHIKTLSMLAAEAGVKVVATNDSHFTEACDCDAHDAWLTLSQGSAGKPVRLDDPERWRFNGSGYHLRTESEMRSLYPNAKTWQAACDETVRVAERIEDDVIPYVALRLPKFPVPAARVSAWEATGATLEDRKYKTASAFYLHERVLIGAKQRYDVLTPELKERLSFEEGVITGMGLEDYFLIVGDVLEWARSDRGYPTAEFPEGKPGEKKPILVGPGRGSAAGSAISYAMWIVMVEPLKNGLLFERFLDPTRLGMPDIDVDFEAARRDEVYTYLAAKYGEEYIARIGAFQMAKTKRAIKDAARLLDLAPLGIKLADAVPVHGGKPQEFAQLFEEVRDKETNKIIANPEGTDFRALVAKSADARRIVALARSFEDVTAGESIHAAGVIISDEPLTNLIPMRRLRDKNGVPVGVPVALWDGKDIDDFGMLKLDALSLRNLDIIAAAVEHIEATTGEVVNPDLLPDPDSEGDERVDKAFALLRDGRTSGIFQLESSGITELTELIAPTEFNDLSALVALYRPGPMGDHQHTLYADRKNDRVPTENAWTRIAAERAVIDPIVADTYLTIAYQEQMMVLAERVAGFDMGEKNKLRKAFSKKDRPAMEALKETFIERGQGEMELADGTHKIAFSAATLTNLWRTFDASAEYLFNKSHSAAYGYLAYVTAYLKANWPTEYGAGILGVTDKADKRLPALFALNQDGIEVLGPDVNLSRAGTAPDPLHPSAVRLGLTEIRDVGNNGHWVVVERDKNGPFKSMHDLMTRVKVPGQSGELTSKLSITAVEGLIEAGAFDSLGLARLGLLLAVRATSADFKPDIPDAEWSPLERSTRQRVRLGIALGDHPMQAYRETLKQFAFQPREDRFGNEFGGRPAAIHRVLEMPKGNMLTVGVLTSWAERTTRNGGKMANFTLEGTKAAMPGTIFNEAIREMHKNGTTPNVGDIVALAGAVKSRKVTSSTIDPESGEEIEETREVRELTGSFMEVVTVDTRPDYTLAEIAPDNVVHLSDYIPAARARAAQLAKAKKAAAPAAKAKKAAAPVKKSSPPVNDDIEDFTDDDLAADAAPMSVFFDLDAAPAPAEPLGVKPRTPGDDGPWAGVMFVQNAIGVDPLTRLLSESLDPDAFPSEDSMSLRGLFGLTGSRNRPSLLMNGDADRAFRVAGGCFCTCAYCRPSDPTARPACTHHEGPATCNCTKGCAELATREGEFLLVMVTEDVEVAVERVSSVNVEDPAWVDCKGAPGWSMAFLSDFALTGTDDGPSSSAAA